MTWKRSILALASGALLVAPLGATTAPGGWTVRGSCAGLGSDAAWVAVIGNVTRVTFPFADPATAWFFQIWDIGIDSVRINFRAGR